MTARWMEAYSLADEKAARARVRLIISGLFVACAMSWDRLSRASISRLYLSMVREVGSFGLYAFARMPLSSWTWTAIWFALARMLSRASSSSVLGMSRVASRKAFLARSVAVRGPVTLKSVTAAGSFDSGPADRSRSVWSCVASSVACLVILVSSCM